MLSTKKHPPNSKSGGGVWQQLLGLDVSEKNTHEVNFPELGRVAGVRDVVTNPQPPPAPSFVGENRAADSVENLSPRKTKSRFWKQTVF